MLGLGTYTTRGGYTAHVTNRGLGCWLGTIEGAGAGGDPGSGLWRDDGRDYYGHEVFDILPPPPTPVEERDREMVLYRIFAFCPRVGWIMRVDYGLLEGLLYMEVQVQLGWAVCYYHLTLE